MILGGPDIKIQVDVFAYPYPQAETVYLKVTNEGT